MHIKHNDFIIWHIPKCAGSYVMRFMEANGIEHELSPRTTPPIDYIELHLNGCMSGHNIPCEWELIDIPSIVFIRHPLLWYRSFWEYRVTHGWRHDALFDVRTASEDFNIFIDKVLYEYPGGFLTHVYRHYAEAATFLGRQETIYQDLTNFLSYYAGIDDLQDVGTVNAGAHMAFYADGQIDAVIKMESRAIGEYGYDYIPEGL